MARRARKTTAAEEPAPLGEGGDQAVAPEGDIFDQQIAARQAEAAQQNQALQEAMAQPQSPAQPQQEREPGAGPEESQGKFQSKFPARQGNGIILLDGEGRKAQLVRNNQFQQMMIFITAPEGVDPRPSKEDTQFLKDSGFRWRQEEKAWTRQMLSEEDKQALEHVKSEEGEQAAKLERGRRRADGIAEAERVFKTFADTIRMKNGKEPSEFSVLEDRSR